METLGAPWAEGVRAAAGGAIFDEGANPPDRGGYLATHSSDWYCCH